MNLCLHDVGLVLDRQCTLSDQIPPGNEADKRSNAVPYGKKYIIKI